MPATLMGRHWAVSGDLQGQVAAGQDPGGKQRTTQDHAHHTGPRPPHGATPTTRGHAHQRLHQPQRDKGRPDTPLKGNRGDEGTKGMLGPPKQRR